MRLTSKVSGVAAVVAAIALTVSAADAQSVARAKYTGPYAYGANGAGSGRDFVYGANRAPYGSNEDNPRDFQLQGTH